MNRLVVLGLAAWLVQGDAPPRFAPFPGALRVGTPSLTNAIADYDRDGDLDVFVGMNGTPNRLYRNEGGGRFAEVGAEAGVADARATRSAAWLDYDGDGDPDLLVGDNLAENPFDGHVVKPMGASSSLWRFRSPVPRTSLRNGP